MTNDARSHDLEKLIVDLAQAFPRSGTSVDDTLTGVTAAAMELIPGAVCCDVLLIDDGEYRSMGATSPLAAELDDVQLRLGEGPCLQAANAESIIRCPDMRDERRFPRFAAAALQRGVASSLAFQLYTRGPAGLGALNVFGRGPLAFTPGAEALGAVLATHAAVALAAVNTHQQFQSALASRDQIGQAKGMIMERFQIDSVAAFDMLKKLSQDMNVPLRDVAAKVIEKR